MTYLLALPPPSAIETRTDMPLYLPVSVYGGDRLLPRRLAALTHGWGGKSQVGVCDWGGGWAGPADGQAPRPRLCIC